MIADSLSRSKPLRTECQFDPTFFEQILDLLPTLSIVLSATCRIAHLQDYLSPFPDLSVKGIDAHSHMWDFLRVLYAFPPTPLLSAVLGRIRVTSHPVLLLAPAWPRQSWYSSLVELSVVHAARLPL